MMTKLLCTDLTLNHRLEERGNYTKIISWNIDSLNSVLMSNANIVKLSRKVLNKRQNFIINYVRLWL